jgi:hypothetical protein
MVVSNADRVMYLRNYVGQFHRAVAEGYPLKALLPVELDGQFRMGGRLHQTVRYPLHRLQDSGAHPEVELRLAQGSSSPEPPRLRRQHLLSR